MAVAEARRSWPRSPTETEVLGEQPLQLADLERRLQRSMPKA